VSKQDLGRVGALRPLWLDSDALRERVAEAPCLYGFFSFESALSQRASHGHVRTHPAARASLARLVTSPRTRAAVLSGRRVQVLQRRLRLQRAAYVGVYGAEVQSTGLRLVTEPELEVVEAAVVKLRKLCAKSALLQAPGVALEDRTWALGLHLRAVAPAEATLAAIEFANLAASCDLVLRSSPGLLEACDAGSNLGKAALGLLAGQRGALAVAVGAGDADEEAFAAVHQAGGITIHVGTPPRQGTMARYMVQDTGEVIRLMHWLSDARRRPA
jgi:trehalose-phosphatase